MPRPLSTLSILALLAVTGTVTAQTAAPASDAPAAVDEPAAAAPDSDTIPNLDELPMGEEVVDTAQPGTPYLRETEGDWGIECLRPEEGQEESCQMFQALQDGNGNVVSNVRIFKLAAGGQAVAGALIAVPLETLLTAQLTIGVDGANPKRYPFTVCDRLGCYARIGLSAEDIAAFRRGAKATVGIVPFVAPDERLQLDMSLKGFTAGFGKATDMQN